jgi:hypothetical protein
MQVFPRLGELFENRRNGYDDLLAERPPYGGYSEPSPLVSTSTRF